jgi:hypothetical protein
VIERDVSSYVQEESSSEFLCTIDYVCKTLCVIEELDLCLDLILGWWIWCLVRRSPIQCKAWIYGLVHMSR